MTPKQVNSIHQDCIHYKHDHYLNKYCCGGKHLKQMTEMVFCDGISISCLNCINCKKFEPYVETRNQN